MAAWSGQRAASKEERDLANNQFVYFATTLPHFRLDHPKANQQIVAVARNFVNQFASGQRVYQVMVDEASRATKPFSFTVANPTATDVIRDTVVVAGAFTRDGWKFMHTELGRIAKYTMSEQWVTGEAKRLSPVEQDSLVTFVRQRYVADFAAKWRHYLRSATVLGAGTLQTEGKRIQTLAGPASPLLRLLAAASLHTSVDTAVLGNRFHAVRAVVPAATGDVLIQESNKPYMAALSELGNAAAAAADAKAAEEVGAAAKKLTDAASQLSQTFRPDPDGDVDGVVKALLEAPARTVGGLARGVTAVDRDAQDFCVAFLKVANRYPINPDSGDVSVAEFTSVFHPVTGQVARLLRGSLRDIVAVQGTHVTRRPDAAYQVSPKFLDLLSKSLEIGRTFYANGAATPSFTFSVRGQPGPDVPRITLVLDDQPPIVWAAGPQMRELSWSVASGRRAELKGKYGTDQEMAYQRNGSWALLRLFGQDGHSTVADVLEWPIDDKTSAPQSSGRAIRLQVDRGQNVLSRGIFTGLRECAMIDR
jgi:type VI protein secretion system component VasK